MNKFNFFKILFTFLSCFSYVANVTAIELNASTLTIPLDNSGNAIVLTPEQVKRGKRLFNASCAACHTGGITKTNPNVGLDPDSLSLATPNRTNIMGLVDYMKKV